MNTKTEEHPEIKKTWQTPKLVVYGDIEKITGEKIGGGLGSSQ